jgi:hypothetical protein
MINQSIPK